jgi:hypothetical protein
LLVDSFSTVKVASVVGHYLAYLLAGQVPICAQRSNTVQLLSQLLWSCLHRQLVKFTHAPVISLSVQILSAASCRFGDTVHPSFNFDLCLSSNLLDLHCPCNCAIAFRSIAFLLATFKAQRCFAAQWLLEDLCFGGQWFGLQLRSSALPFKCLFCLHGQVFELLSISTCTEPFKKGGHFVGHWTSQAFRLENESFSVQNAGHHGQGPLCTVMVTKSLKGDWVKEGCKSKDMHTLMCDAWIFVHVLGQ